MRIILSHVCDYDVIKLDGELPHLKEKSYIMKERLQKSHENILGPFCKLDEFLLDKISSYVTGFQTGFPDLPPSQTRGGR